MRDTLQWFHRRPRRPRAVRRDSWPATAGRASKQGGRASRQLGFQPALCVGPSPELHGHALHGAGRRGARFRPEMRAVIAADGWPASIASPRRRAGPSPTTNSAATASASSPHCGSSAAAAAGARRKCGTRAGAPSPSVAPGLVLPARQEVLRLRQPQLRLCRFERGNAECVAEVADRPRDATPAGRRVAGRRETARGAGGCASSASASILTARSPPRAVANPSGSTPWTTSCAPSCGRTTAGARSSRATATAARSARSSPRTGRRHTCPFTSCPRAVKDRGGPGRPHGRRPRARRRRQRRGACRPAARRRSQGAPRLVCARAAF